MIIDYEQPPRTLEGAHSSWYGGGGDCSTSFPTSFHLNKGLKQSEAVISLNTYFRKMVKPTAAPTRAALKADEMTAPVIPFLRFEGGASNTITIVSTSTHIESVKGKKENKIIAKDSSSNIGKERVVVVGGQECTRLLDGAAFKQHALH